MFKQEVFILKLEYVVAAVSLSIVIVFKITVDNSTIGKNLMIYKRTVTKKNPIILK